jgi:methyl-accepting chemotaxis protein
LHASYQRIEEQSERLRELSLRDELTQLHNRRYFDQQIAKVDRRADSGTALALGDVDFFKQINDEHGHLAGDAVLEELARLLMQAVRSQDLVARFGGEEFIMLLRGTTLEEARAIMERIRQLVEQHSFLYQHQTITVTISLGLTAYQMGYRRMDDWLQCVDQRLYEAKRRGRNRVA